MRFEWCNFFREIPTHCPSKWRSNIGTCFFYMVALGVVAAAPQRRLRLDEERRLKEAAGDINGVV
jgi:hypothetical protein